jgi:hypothetical protein
MLRKKSIVMAFVALAAAATMPAPAHEPFTQSCRDDACMAQPHGPSYARGAGVNGLAREASGFGQWPVDAVIECSQDLPAQSAF